MTSKNIAKETTQQAYILEMLQYQELATDLISFTVKEPENH